MGQEALDNASIVDTLAATKLAPADAAAFMMWGPALKWVAEWDEAKFGDLTGAGAAIRQQDWGSGVARPQDIERLYVDPATKTLWVEVVFASFVQLGPGITDRRRRRRARRSTPSWPACTTPATSPTS